MLCYHAVSDTWPADLALPAHRLYNQLDYLVSRGYRGATFSDAIAAPRRGRTLVVTFDDAYQSTLTRGKPVLDQLGLPATVFVPTAYPDRERPMVWPGIDQWQGGPHEHELLPLSWSELASLERQGWEVGSHTVTHPRLTALREEALKSELVESRDACAHATGSACRSLAYPYGDVNAGVVEATRAAGYAAAAALPARPHPERALEWPRIGVYSIDDRARFAVKVSPVVRHVRSVTGI